MKKTIETKKTIKAPKDSKKKMKKITARNKDKKLFQTQIESARKSLQGFKILPI